MSVRSVIAVLGGIVLVSFLMEILEPPAVAWLAAQRPADMDAYLAARTEPAVLWARGGLYVFVGILAGYMVAKIAGAYEMAHALVAALMQCVIMFNSFSADPAGAAIPLAVRIGLTAATGAAIMAGAAIRARAAGLTPDNEVKS